MSSRGVRRIRTGIEKLDEMLFGGIPRGDIVLLSGGPGTGKTVLATQFIYNGARLYGESGVYVTFTESAESFESDMRTLGWDLRPFIEEGKLVILDMLAPKSGMLDEVLNLILEKVEETGAERLVIDSVTAMLMSLKERVDVRTVLITLQRFLRKLGCTSILVVETPWGERKIGSGVEEFIADGIILLEMIAEVPSMIRRIAILKMRGTKIDERFYRFEIVEGKGIVISSYPESFSKR